MRLDDRCQPIELILSDVDGVLTDGGLIFDNQGQELKQFHIRDGLGIKLWQRAGYHLGLVTLLILYNIMLPAQTGVDRSARREALEGGVDWIEVGTPRNMSKKQKQILRAFAESRGEDLDEAEKGGISRVKNLFR